MRLLNKLQIFKFIVSILALATVSSAKYNGQKSTLDERLNIYQYQNGQSLLEFDYSFSKQESESDSKAVHGLYPAHFEQLFSTNPELEWLELSLVQGRWNQQLNRKINAFQSTQLSSGSPMPGSRLPGRDAAIPQGLTMTFNKM